MLTVSKEVKSISDSALRVIKQNCSAIKVRTVLKVENPTNTKQMYEKKYSQQDRSKPNLSETIYSLNGVVDSQLNDEVRKTFGISEECNLLVTLITKELIDVGLLSQTNNVPDILDIIRDGKLFEIDGVLYSPIQVSIPSMYKHFPVQVIVGCKLYK